MRASKTERADTNDPSGSDGGRGLGGADDATTRPGTIDIDGLAARALVQEKPSRAQGEAGRLLVDGGSSNDRIDRKLPFDDRMRQMIAEGDRGNGGSVDDTTAPKSANVTVDDGVKQKLDEPEKTLNVTGGLADAPDDAADARFNDRLKRKLAGEQNTSSECGGLAEGYDSAVASFDDRFKQKLAEKINANGKSVDLAAASKASDERINNGLKQKLVEEDKPKSKMVDFATAPNAIDKFEDRLKQKVSQADNTKRGAAGIASASNASDDKFDDCLGRKVSQDDNTKNNSVGVSAAPKKADERLADHLNRDGGANCELDSATTASGRFHNRLKQKLSEDDGKKGNAVNVASPSNGAQELFEDRLRMKAMSSTESDGGGSPNERRVTEGTGSVVSNENNCIAASVDADRSPSLKNFTQGEHSIIDENVSDAESGIILMERIAYSTTNQSGQSIASEESDDLGRRSVEPTGAGRSFVGRMASTLQAHVSATGEYLVTATLVEDAGAAGEVVMAERVGVFERKGKLFAFAFCLLAVVIAIVTPLSLMMGRNANGGAAVAMPIPTDVPSVSPSMPPSFDPRPTLQIVQERGVLRCGVFTPLGERMCQAAASVILGDPNSCELTNPPSFRELQERSLDVMLEARHTVKREVNQPSTGAGFSFSMPYLYDDTFYRGNRTYVECAQNQTRHGICSALLICIPERMPGYAIVKSKFPPNFYVTERSEMLQMLLNSTCNVFAAPVSTFFSKWWRDSFGEDDATIIGKKPLMSSPWAIATRNSDEEFSDVMNWVLNALIYGDERGLKDDASLCQNYTTFPRHASELNFLNGIYCAGNYSSILAAWRGENSGESARNRVDDGSAGLLYATPFGSEGGDIDGVGAAALLNEITDKGPLQCGVVVPDDFDDDIMTVSGLVGMHVDFCRALSAALFSGNANYVNVTAFLNQNGFVALNDGVIDVLAGAKAQKDYDFANPSTGLKGFDFSKPYFFGNESIGDDLTIHALATREDNAIFSSFVNSAVLAPINAQAKGIDKEQNNFMSLMPWFGGNFAWALRDVVSYTGSYDELYEKHFGVIPKEERGRNRLNEGGPLLYSIPGLSREIGKRREEG